MDHIAPEVVALLQYLLPGFLASWVFHGLTPYPRLSEFERVVHALIFLLFVLPVAAGAKVILMGVGRYWQLGEWTDNSALVVSVASALFVGTAFSYLANTDRLHKLLRRRGLTQETSYPSEWFGAFHSQQTYIVLHLKDERRLWGWPKEWPSSSKSGHFMLEQPCWLVNQQYQRIDGAEALLIESTEVKWVEFVEKFWPDATAPGEVCDEQKRLKSPSANYGPQSLPGVSEPEPAPSVPAATPSSTAPAAKIKAKQGGPRLQDKIRR